jgi:mono/diheme cytochrome c family protein
MPDLKLDEEQIDDLLAFFRFIEGIDTNNWPPPETLSVRGVPLPDTGAVAEGAAHFKSLGCMLCHTANGSERRSKTGPDLTFAASRLTRDWMIQEILDPRRDFADSPMPEYGDKMSPEIAAQIVAFLEYVNERNGGKPRAASAAAMASKSSEPAELTARAAD